MENQQQTLRAEIYLVLSALFRQAPSEEMVSFLSELEIEQSASAMQSAWIGLQNAARESNQEALNDEYQELFIGIGRGEVMSVLTAEDEELQQVFFNKHLATWFNALTKQIKSAHHANFYVAVAELTDAFMTLEQVRFSENLQSGKNKLKIDVKNVTEYEQAQQ